LAAAGFVGFGYANFMVDQGADARFFRRLALLSVGGQAQGVGALHQQLAHDQRPAGGVQRLGMAGGRVVLQLAGQLVLGDGDAVDFNLGKVDVFDLGFVVGATHFDDLRLPSPRPSP
jgi:hypothetical protein